MSPLPATPVTRDKAEGFGIMKTDASGQITNFVEKPKDPSLLENLKLTPAQLRESGFDAKDERSASMGIYIFSRKALEDCLLGNSMMDFGREIIPAAIRGSKVQSYLFKGYWEDIGTIRSFHQANLELTDLVPNYNFFDLENPIYTRARFLPASKINAATIERCLISDGCIIDKSHLKRSIIGVRSLIEEGCQISDSVIMGADYFNQAAGFGLPNASPRSGSAGEPGSTRPSSTKTPSLVKMWSSIPMAVPMAKMNTATSATASPSSQGNDHPGRDGRLSAPVAMPIRTAPGPFRRWCCKNEG